jgi:hypothetical protein
VTTDLERDLTRVLGQRAALVDAAPRYQLALAPETSRPRGQRWRRPRRPRRDPESRRMWSGLVTAAVVAAVVALGVTAWIGAGKHPLRDTQSGLARCVASGSGRFATALRHGALPTGDVVLSGAADAGQLVAVQRDGVTRAVEVWSAPGRTVRVWTAKPNERLWAIANPFGALSDQWVAFVLAPLGGTGGGHALVANTANGQVVTLQPDPGYRMSDDPLLAPIVMHDAVSLVESSRSGSSAQLSLYWADSTRHTSSVRTGVSRTVALLPVGGNVVTIRTGTNGLVAVDFDQPTYRPSTLEPAARHGYAFASDGTTLTWLSQIGARYYRWQWAPGDPSALRRAITGPGRPVATAGRFAVMGDAASPAAQHLFDSVTGRMIVLPAGTALRRVDGTTATLTDHSTALLRYRRVPTAALTAC